MMGWKGNSLKNGKCSVGINVRFLGSKHPDNCHLSSWASKPWSSFVITVGSWRDPFIGLWNNPPKNWVVFHPRIFHPANQGEMITTHLLLTIIPKLSKLSVFFSFFSCTVFTYFFQQQKDFFFGLGWLKCKTPRICKGLTTWVFELPLDPKTRNNPLGLFDGFC